MLIAIINLIYLLYIYLLYNWIIFY